MKVRVTSSGAYRAINGSASTIRAVDQSFGVVSGAANISFTASGAISGITLAPVSGSANLSFTASGSVSAVAPVSGRADLAFTTAGTLSGIGYVSGHADLSFTSAGSIVAYVPVSGRADLAFSAAGSITGLRYVSGRADLSFSASGALSALAPVSGHANLSFTASGSLVGLTDPKLYDKFEAVYTARSTLLNAILTAGMTREEAAQQAADAAKAQAAAALARLDDIAADGKLTLDEQKRAKPDYDTIIDQQAGLDATATSYGITAEKTAYDNSVTALKDYLRFCGGASGVLDASFAWVGAGSTLSISRTDWDYRWGSVYTSKQALLNKIVDAAKALANSAQGTADAAQGAADSAQQAADAANQANAVVNPKFAADLSSWTFDTAGASEWYRGSGGNSPDASVSTYLLHLGQAGQSVTVARNTGGGLSVNPGQGVTATVALRSLSANAGAHAYVRIGWYNSAGVEIGNSTNGVTVCPTNFVQGVSRVYGTAPPNAARAVAEVEFDGHTSGYFSITAASIAALPGNLDEVPDSATWAKIRGSELTDGRHNLGIGNSGARLGSLRNQVMVGVGNYGAGWSGGNITYASTNTTATITAGAAVLQNGDDTIAYNQSSTTVSTGSNPGGRELTYYLYYDDDNYTGGSKVLHATLSELTALSANGRVYVGEVLVFYPASGTSSGDGAAPCPDEDAWVLRTDPNGLRADWPVRAKTVRASHFLRLTDGKAGLVTYSERKPADRVRVAAEGKTLTCSTSAPLELAGTAGECVLAPESAGRLIKALAEGVHSDVWVDRVEDAGPGYVQHITCQNACFWTGDDPDYLFGHHNLKSRNSGL